MDLRRTRTLLVLFSLISCDKKNANVTCEEAIKHSFELLGVTKWNSSVPLCPTTAPQEYLDCVVATENIEHLKACERLSGSAASTPGGNQ